MHAIIFSRSEPGFTMVEIAILLAILVILAAVVWPILPHHNRGAR